VEPWELSARESVRALVARYNALGDRGRIEWLAALFCEDAKLEVPGEPTIVGRAAIAAFFERVTAGSSEDARAGAGPGYIHHHTATHDLTIEDAEHGSGTCYFQVLSAAGLDHWGRYVDAYRREGGCWRFAARRVEVDGRTPGGWAERREAERAGD
jgi:hypothetical protein